jgi:LSD1 subclass zinc finger protein
MSETQSGIQAGATLFPCTSCGARLEFSPGAAALKCPYCGQENRLEKPAGQVQELDFYEFFARAAEQGDRPSHAVPAVLPQPSPGTSP